MLSLEERILLLINSNKKKSIPQHNNATAMSRKLDIPYEKIRHALNNLIYNKKVLSVNNGIYTKIERSQ